MGHSYVAPWCIVARVVVPGYDIHFFCPLEVVETFVRSHQVCGDRCFFVVFADRVTLHFVVVQHAVGVETHVVEGHSCKCSAASPWHSVSQIVRRYNLVPVVDGVAPELHVPCLVDFIECFVFVFQPYAERFCTVLAVALAAVLIADVPADDVFVVAVTLCQFFCQALCIFLENRAVRAGIVAMTEFVMASFEIGSCHFRITVYHPCRECAGGCCHDDLDVLFCQGVYDLIELCKVVLILGRLDFCPGKYVDRGAVDAGLMEKFHILIPDLFWPLVWVVVSSV